MEYMDHDHFNTSKRNDIAGEWRDVEKERLNGIGRPVYLEKNEKFKISFFL